MGYNNSFYLQYILPLTQLTVPFRPQTSCSVFILHNSYLNIPPQLPAAATEVREGEGRCGNRQLSARQLISPVHATQYLQ